MATAKIAISLDEGTVKRLDRLVKNRIFPSRSKVIQDAVEEKLNKMGKSRLARECAKLDPEFEKALAEEGLSCELIKDLLSNEGSGRNDLSSQSEEILRKRFRNTRR
jgi:Arc/MetJ-type ribon-helix-helix transcriptional regulator